MKRIKAINGYTIFQATARDEKRYNVREGMYYIYFSSDIRDFGIANSYSDFDDIESLEEAIEICGGNHAIARELCESYSTAVSYEDVERAEELLDSGLDLEDVERILFLDDAEDDEEAIEHDIALTRMFADGVERKRTLAEIAREIESKYPHIVVEIVGPSFDHRANWVGHIENLRFDLTERYCKHCVQGIELDKYGFTITMR